MIETRKAYSTATDYAALPEGALYQLIDSELIMSPSPTSPHQISLGNLHGILWHYLKGGKVGSIYIAPFDVHFSEKEIYQPDLFVILNGNTGTMETNGFHGAPDIVFEFISPSSAYYDLRHKKSIYEQTGVREYWIVDPREYVVECHLNSDRGFTRISQAHTEGIIPSSILQGFTVDLQDLFTNT